jgi:hypothetical protein
LNWKGETARLVFACGTENCNVRENRLQKSLLEILVNLELPYRDRKTSGPLLFSHLSSCFATNRRSPIR